MFIFWSILFGSPEYLRWFLGLILRELLCWFLVSYVFLLFNRFFFLGLKSSLIFLMLGLLTILRYFYNLDICFVVI